MALTLWSSAKYVLPLPAGHRFPVAKYAMLRDRVITGNDAIPQHRVLRNWKTMAGWKGQDVFRRRPECECHQCVNRAGELPMARRIASASAITRISPMTSTRDASSVAR